MDGLNSFLAQSAGEL